MEEYFDGFDFDCSALAYRYGKCDYSKIYKEIAMIEDINKRNKEIDKLIDLLVSDNENNGFFAPEDIVYINRMFGNAIKLDDREVYYDFFSNLNYNFKNITDKSEGFIIMSSVIKTVYQYFGMFDFENNKRFELTDSYFDKDDNLVVPSIKTLKGMNSAACVEYSSLAHNLWLMTGVTSYYVLTKDTYIDNSDDGHAFIIIEYDNKYKIFDMAQGIYKALDINPIELFKKKRPFIVDDKIYTYASYLNKNNKK